MSASALKTAAEIMRADWAGTTQEEFHNAVADWLDQARDAHLHIAPGNYPFYVQAVAVARAYLGTDK